MKVIKDLTMPFDELMRIMQGESKGCIVENVEFLRCYFTDCPPNCMTFIPFTSSGADLLRAWNKFWKKNPYTYGAFLIGQPPKFLLCNTQFNGCTFAAKKQ